MIKELKTDSLDLKIYPDRLSMGEAAASAVARKGNSAACRTGIC